MTYDTINDAVTRAGGAGALLMGRYRIVRPLGQGGMGSVWLAEDTQLDNKLFAIKMLPSILANNKRAYAQLKKEALVAMDLSHTNIVTVRAFEENSGNPFLVMDYIDGKTLDDYLAEHGEYFMQRRREAEAQSGRARSPSAPQGGGFGRVEHVERVDGDGIGITGDEVVRILKPIAAALDYAHSKGVIHRDVKPGNVMIAKDGTPYILDFGIAREIQETMTRVTGKLSSGTLLYMSPEQLMGEDPSAAQDVYSFAAMAYECLKGKPPFSHGQIEFQIMNKLPDPLPTEGLTGKVAILAAGVMAGLAKKPEDRPATCMAVLEGDNLTQRRREAELQSGRARSPSGPQPEGSRPVATDDAQPGRARSPSAPQGDDNVRVEHVERVEGETRDDGNGKVPRKKMIIGRVALLGLSMIGGLWWFGGRVWASAKFKSEWERRELRGTEAEDNGHTKVQLWKGGPYWADTNIGAEKPWDYGYYFWWGDTVGYKRVNGAWVASDGSSSNFSFSIANTPTYWKNSSQLLDGKWITAEGVLAPKHDVAQVQWCGGWRMPTKQELYDLNSKCDWTWVKMNGVNGYVVRGRGNYETRSIFLPCAGYGNGTSLNHSGSDGSYWSSVPSSDSSGSWYLDFNSSDHDTYSGDRRYGFSVRPVQGFTK